MALENNKANNSNNAPSPETITATHYDDKYLSLDTYLSLDIICSSKLTVFLELRSQKTVRFWEQIMSADKYPSIFSHQMETIVYIFSCQMKAIVLIFLQIFFAARSVLKTGEYLSDIPQFWLGHIQSRNAFKPFVRERKYLMDYSMSKYLLCFRG